MCMRESRGYILYCASTGAHTWGIILLNELTIINSTCWKRLCSSAIADVRAVSAIFSLPLLTIQLASLYTRVPLRCQLILGGIAFQCFKVTRSSLSRRARIAALWIIKLRRDNSSLSLSDSRAFAPPYAPFFRNIYTRSIHTHTYQHANSRNVCRRVYRIDIILIFKCRFLPAPLSTAVLLLLNGLRMDFSYYVRKARRSLLLFYCIYTLWVHTLYTILLYMQKWIRSFYTYIFYAQRAPYLYIRTFM